MIREAWLTIVVLHFTATANGPSVLLESRQHVTFSLKVVIPNFFLNVIPSNTTSNGNVSVVCPQALAEAAQHNEMCRVLICQI